MTQTQVNQIITEKVMGECYHDFPYSYPVTRCTKCLTTFRSISTSNNPDFSTWKDWGRCLKKIQREEWWAKFAYKDGIAPPYWEDAFIFNEDLLNPTKGSHTLAEFVRDNPQIFGEI